MGFLGLALSLQPPPHEGDGTLGGAKIMHAPDHVPAISVVIPCKGHAQELAHCLQGFDVQEGGFSFEIIVVDSANDPEVQAIASRFPRARLLQSAERLSAGAARNLGAKHAAAKVLGFVDADCIPEPGWLAAAVTAIEAGAVLASGPILDALPWHFIAASDNRLQFVDFPGRRPAGSHPYFPGAHLAVPREIFESFGGFDPEPATPQDVLLTARVAAAWPVRARFCPEMVVRHWGRRRWGDFLGHQHSFGFSRARHRLRMDSSLEWLGRHPVLAWAVILRRLLYISGRVIQWNLLDFPRFVLQLPCLVAGLIAWAQGFYAGMRTTLPSSTGVGKPPPRA